MSSAMDEFRAQREAVEDVRVRLTEVAELLRSLRQETAEFARDETLRKPLNEEQTWLLRAQDLVRQVHRPRPRFQSRSRTHKRNNATRGLHHRLRTAVSEESLRQRCDFLCKTPGDCETSVTRLDQTHRRRYKRRACLCFTLVVRTFSRTHESRSARMRSFEWLAPGVVAADGLWVRHCHRVRRRPVRRQVAGIIDAHTVIAGGCRPAQGGRSGPGAVIPDIRCGARRSVPRADRHAEGHRRQRPDRGQTDFDQPRLRHREQMRGRRLECERTLERVRRPCGIRRRGR
jgi:hypothetical protein